MLDVTPDSVIAGDGGGTRCRLAFATDSDACVVEVGAANISTDFNAALAEITRGLKNLCEKTGLDEGRIKRMPAYLGIAGTTGPALAGRLAKALPLDHTLVEDDRPAALIGALGARDGAIAHCGTGSFLAAGIRGQVRLAGGWGPVVGDEASAQWVGRKTLAETLNALDGLLTRTDLADEILRHFGSGEAIVAFAADASPADFGFLAQRTTRAAAAGDAIAVSVLTSAADYIAGSLPRLGWKPDMALCLTGGIGPEYARYLPTKLQASLVEPAGTPLDGAIALARKFSRETAS